MTLFAILLGGNLTVTPRLRRQIAGARFIAADSGMMHAAMLGIVPELWVGDFDSSGSELQIAYKHVARDPHPSEKDMTDGELAVNHALERGASQFVLAGGLGGQSDHALAHVGLALSLAKSGRSCLLTSGEEEGVPILPGQTSLELASGDRISIVPLSDIAGFDLEGVKWPLSQRQVDLGSSLTVSNVAKGSVQVRIRSGCGIAFLYPSGDR